MTIKATPETIAPMPEARPFGTIEIEADLPVEKVEKPKLAKVTYKDAIEMLSGSSAGDLVGLLEKCGGDVDVYVSSFDLHAGGNTPYGRFTSDTILSRTMFILYSAGNEAYLQKWELLVKSFKMARLLKEEGKAYDAIKKMPIPGDKADLKDWIAYCGFWLGDLREEKKTHAKKSMPVTADPAVMELIELLNRRKKETNGGD